MIRERPILFSAPMVLAILDGRKTQTRRIIKPQPRTDWLGYTMMHSKPGVALLNGPDYPDDADDELPCPYGAPGDRLWVRERCYEGTHSGGRPWVRYAADGEHQLPRGTRWRPSIHMHRWASRILLEVTEVRVQRLKQISEQDARAEGVEPLESLCSGERPRLSHLISYEITWNDINGRGSWDANPWVWAVSFCVLEPRRRPAYCCGICGADDHTAPRHTAALGVDP